MLAVDIGNTNITLGAMPSAGPTGEKGFPSPLAVWRLSTHRHATSDEVAVTLGALLSGVGLDRAGLEGVCIASVVPPLDGVFRQLSTGFLGRSPLFVGLGVETGIHNLYDVPTEVGADRIVNASAAYSIYNKPLIVVDFGTATTFDCVGDRGSYLGGAIAPGPQTAAEALYQKTAKLPLLGSFARPAKAIGKNTRDSISSGLFHGYVGLTRGILGSILTEMPSKTMILATGGLASLLTPSIPEIKAVHPDLTLEGLWRIWRVNFVDKPVDNITRRINENR